MMISPKIDNKKTLPKKPVSSAITEKIKSVGATVLGRKPKTFWVPFMYPLPETPPLPTANNDCLAFHPSPVGFSEGWKKV